MKSFRELSEDLESRKEMLKQRSADTVARYKRKGAESKAATENRRDALVQKAKEGAAAANEKRKKEHEDNKAKSAAKKMAKAQAQDRKNLKQEIRQELSDK